jgi:hypothetical protein
MADNQEDREWQELWEARVAAIENVLGKSEDTVAYTDLYRQSALKAKGA